MHKLIWLLSVICAPLLLAVSFFVLSAISREEKKRLKVFGYVTAALLWISSAVVLYTLVSALLMKQAPFKHQEERNMPGMQQPDSMRRERMLRQELKRELKKDF